MTHARMTTLQVEPNKVDEGIRFFREQSLAAARRQPGFQGARLLIDRQAGKAYAVTLWESEAALRAAEQAMNQTRAAGVQALGATNVTTEVLELAVNENA
jgi:heme-degrading monooxygenase HmoA